MFVFQIFILLLVALESALQRDLKNRAFFVSILKNQQN